MNSKVACSDKKRKNASPSQRQPSPKTIGETRMAQNGTQLQGNAIKRTATTSRGKGIHEHDSSFDDKYLLSLSQDLEIDSEVQHIVLQMAINDPGLYDIIQAQKSQHTGPRIPLVEDGYDSIFMANDERELQMIDDKSMISNSQCTDVESMTSDNLITESTESDISIDTGDDNIDLPNYLTASDIEPISDQQLDNLAELVLREKNRRQGSGAPFAVDTTTSCPANVKKTVALSKVASSSPTTAIKPVVKSIKNDNKTNANVSTNTNTSATNGVKANITKTNTTLTNKKIAPSSALKTTTAKKNATTQINNSALHAIKPIENVQIKPIPTNRYSAGASCRQGASHPNEKMFRTGPQPPPTAVKAPVLKTTPLYTHDYHIMSLASMQSKISKHLDNVQYNIERAMSTECPTFPRKISAEGCGSDGSVMIVCPRSVFTDPIYDCISLKSGSSSVGDSAPMLCISNSTAFDDMSLGSSGSTRSYKSTSTNSERL